MPATYLIEFRVHPEQRPRFLRLLNGVLDAMRCEANFRSATLHVCPADPCHFLLHETWADHDDVVEVQLQRPYRAEWHAALEELLEEPRKIATWLPLRSDTAGAQELIESPP